ncbi:SIR2 family protein [Paraburkholderia acidipaludis]|uniref:SIR2 family protein n=1 Tax=Paraburkholderia acidipaludis TaxID=660537 RepID=UPI0005BB3173|nr:SIR2 family protein [Paraburkholderia acidipaludis]
MPIELSRLANELIPEKTVLFFGAGACVSSHAPSVTKLMEYFQATFGVSTDGYSLREYAGIIENKFGRKKLIDALRVPFKKLHPTGSLSNIPLYQWKSLFTTNYDTLIEQAYEAKNVDLIVYESNFDFAAHENPLSVKLFKLHGTIDKDITNGHAARIIITDNDYDYTSVYRDGLYARLRSDLYGANLIIIGHSLADEDIKSIANHAAGIVSQTGGVGSIALLMYRQDIDRAELWERRGFRVCFGGIDDFFSALAPKIPATAIAYVDPVEPLDHAPSLRPITVDVAHASTGSSDVSGMFNGWPATYADIEAALTFDRLATGDIVSEIKSDGLVCAVILGPSGVGKTTSARQALLRLVKEGYYCWEHKDDYELIPEDWLTVARILPKYNANGVLLIDDAHHHLFAINRILDAIRAERILNFKIVLTSTRNHWNPRIKSIAFYKIGKTFHMERLKSQEIEWLLNLLESNQHIKHLIGDSFSGFSRYERRRRLIDRFESETFVCLKNIFASEKFDDIILREYASLEPDLQEIYRIVAGMESAGIRVHRQLVIRLLGIPADTIAAALLNLTDIIREYTVSEREGLYAWKCRHDVIAWILAKYKYQDIGEIVQLFDDVIDCISPTYDIEVRSIRELCNLETGLPRITDKETQNRLLRKMMSVAPGERIPRHRLVRNLIQMGMHEKAETEIRIFEKDFGADAPIARYKIKGMVARAVDAPGLLDEDRVAILLQARDFSISAIERYPEHKLILGAYCDVGVEYYRKTGDFTIYDDAMRKLKFAEQQVGDPEISTIVRQYEIRMAGHNESRVGDEGASVSK